MSIFYTALLQTMLVLVIPFLGIILINRIKTLHGNKVVEASSLTEVR